MLFGYVLMSFTLLTLSLLTLFLIYWIEFLASSSVLNYTIPNFFCSFLTFVYLTFTPIIFPKPEKAFKMSITSAFSLRFLISTFDFVSWRCYYLNLVFLCTLLSWYLTKILDYFCLCVKSFPFVSSIAIGTILGFLKAIKANGS